MTDLHVHTTYCDGADAPAAVAAAAAARGMTALGFSGHAHVPFDEGYCMSESGAAAYRDEIAALRAQYAGRLTVLCGVEQDFYSDTDTAGYDYVIGSVHYVKAGGAFIPVDDTAEKLRQGAERHFGGDIYALCEAYYETVSQVVERTGATIIGHFDLITKFQERTPLFDPCHPRYIAAWRRAADRLLPLGVPLELNTGAISRGYRTAPYPAGDILAYWRENGGRVLLASDSHSADALCFGFDRFGDLAGDAADCLPHLFCK